MWLLLFLLIWSAGGILYVFFDVFLNRYLAGRFGASTQNVRGSSLQESATALLVPCNGNAVPPFPVPGHGLMLTGDARRRKQLDEKKDFACLARGGMR